MRVHYEIQTQKHDGRYGFVVTISTEDRYWTSPWSELPPEITTHETAVVEARRQVGALARTLSGG